MKLYIGFDHREDGAYQAAVRTLGKVNPSLPHTCLIEDRLRDAGLLWRSVDRRAGQIYDFPSNANCSTEFAISRFLVPMLAQSGWALFTDCDVLFLADPCEILDTVDKSKAVWVVQHQPLKGNGEKMDGQPQIAYPRKNWSSVMLFNCDHPSNRRLSIRDVNERPGRDLHRFYWLADSEIGGLPPEWNWLVGEQARPAHTKIAHFTLGGPWLPHWKNGPHDDLWLRHAHG